MRHGPSASQGNSLLALWTGLLRRHSLYVHAAQHLHDNESKQPRLGNKGDSDQKGKATIPSNILDLIFFSLIWWS